MSKGQQKKNYKLVVVEDDVIGDDNMENIDPELYEEDWNQGKTVEFDLDDEDEELVELLRAEGFDIEW